MDPASLPKRLAGSAGRLLADAVSGPQVAKAVSDLDARWTQHRHDRKLEDGTLREVRVLVHRGWVARGVAKVHVRVVEEPRLPEAASSLPYWDVFTANLRRHVALSFPDVTVRARIGPAEAKATTDRRGFAALSLDVGDLHPGWHRVDVATVPAATDGPVFRGSGNVLSAEPDAPLLVVSDIDDTVLRTGMTEGLTALRRTLLREDHSRRAVPGMASLYRGLARGVRSADGKRPAEVPCFYVSSGSWALYEMLTLFLQIRGFPEGPIFLSDWGPTDRYVYRSGEEHKTQAIGRLLSAYPDTPVLLIGDSGQQDPEIYCDIASGTPDRIVAVLIIRTGDKSDSRIVELRGRIRQMRQRGVKLLVADDAAEAARLMLELRLCEPEVVDAVRAEMRARF
ncbi:MAG: phosphatase domain-containing protein [Candidatus Nanopelagicales bacterium]|nr:phosphatase domain-containing protein [Candidatus Nanopelagicales bacterium]